MRYQFTCTLSELRQTPLERLHLLLRASAPAEQTAEQHGAWEETLVVLHEALVETPYEGQLYFEFAIPRLGARIDVVMIIEHVVFVLEFKTGAGNTSVTALDQVTDYALDLRYFHRPSHAAVIAPFLVTESKKTNVTLTRDKHDPRMTSVAVVPPEQLAQAIASVLTMYEGEVVARDAWVEGAYEPTPTIVEAARALYRGHRVEEITRSTAGADNLATTSQTLLEVIHAARERNEKVICFVTGVPGAGKTLVGLNLATAKMDESSSQHCVYLSGNGPLVAVLREALVRDAVEQSKQTKKRRKGEVSHGVKAFIQNVHHFRDDSVRTTVAPTERIVVFDEAQRAWNQHMTTDFMKRKKGVQDFHYSEPEFLISCMDRHNGWAVIVCLVGNGQEINRGEAGITAWLEACATRFTEWRVYASPELGANEEQTQVPIEQLRQSGMFMEAPSLHLRASLRSFRSTLVSEFVNSLLSFQPEAGELYQRVARDFPIVLTRDVSAAKQWVREQARGSERYGILASSAAQRLRPYAIDVTSKPNPVHWFLNGKDDVRSSYFLESVATEFDVQGLELDWTCIAWDADFRFQRKARAWDQYSFRGSRWERIQQAERRAYHINAYRVLLTRARQGMVIVVPHGAADDHTRHPGFYDDTYGYLKRVGVREV